MGISQLSWVVLPTETLYKVEGATVRVDSESTTAWLEIKKRVRSGCLNSSLSFNCCCERVLCESADDLNEMGIKINERVINKQSTPIILIALIATLPDDLQKLLDMVNNVTGIWSGNKYMKD